MRLHPDGIIEVHHAEGVVQTLDDAKAQIAMMRQLGGDRLPLRAIVVIGGLNGQAFAARRFFMNDDLVWSTLSRVALVVGSPVSRVIGGMFIGLAQPRVSLRLFSSETAAWDWLRELDE